LEGCEKITVVKFIMDSGGDNGDSSFEVEIWIETAKSANVIVARFRKCKKYDQRR